MFSILRGIKLGLLTHISSIKIGLSSYFAILFQAYLGF